MISLVCFAEMNTIGNLYMSTEAKNDFFLVFIISRNEWLCLVEGMRLCIIL